MKVYPLFLMIKGSHHSVETRAKISISRSGDRHWNYGKHHSAETKNKIRQANKGRKHTPEELTKMQIASSIRKRTPETNAKIALSHLGNKNPNYGKHWTKEEREWRLPIIMANRLQRPTKIERKFQNIVSKYNLPYKYVGDGYTWIVGRCPDFLNINGEKTVVEIFSRWWHDPSVNQRIKPQHTEEATLRHYQQYGFDCIIIWERELKDESQLVEKIRGWQKLRGAR